MARGQLARGACALLIIACLLQTSSAQLAATFLHGVASGDPEPNSIVLWTRITPHNLLQQTSFTPVHALPVFNVTWQVATDAAVTRVVASGSANATVDADYTVKVIPSGLNSSTQYYYNFIIRNGSTVSPTGKFRLPPAAGSPLDSLKYFIFSCSNWPTGFFNAYDLASRYNLDFWFHLGDWYYEYGISSGTGDIRWQPPPQGLQPSGDIQVLNDYRARHALYRTDDGLQALMASAPLIAIWDDHEFENNVWSRGAQNQYPGEVEFYQRKHNALKAYTEWMPIRWNYTATPQINQASDYAINRTFTYGDLATIFMLEDRVTTRTNAGEDSNEFDPATLVSSSTVAQPLVGNVTIDQWASNSTIDQGMLALQRAVNIKRTNQSDLMLGPAQIAWIEEQTKASAANRIPWQLYFQGTIMQDWFSPDPLGALEQNLAPNAAVASYWQQLFNNLTSNTPGATYTTYSTSAYQRNLYGQVSNVTAAIRASTRTQAALGKYKINSDADSWQGYLWDRYRFLNAIGAALNPTVYAGDSHNFWAGYLTLVNPDEYVNNGSYVPTEPIAAVEFDGGSVTSNGYESSTTFPQDFQNAAWLAANPNMFHVEVRYRGGMYVELTHDNQHVEYIYVNTIASQDYKGFCGAAFDVPARTSLDQDIEAIAGNCTGIPAGRPYGGGALQNPAGVQWQNSSLILSGTAMPMDNFLVESS